MKFSSINRRLNTNERIIAKNTVVAMVLRGLGIFVSFAMTPAFIRYFNNNEVLGLWFTILSVLIWIMNFDLGIGNGIRNFLVKALTDNDRIEARRVISSGFISVGVLSAVFLIGGLVFLYIINLNWLFNISPLTITNETLLWSSACVYIGIVISFFLTNVKTVFYALQSSYVNNILSFISSILMLIYVLLFRFTDSNEALKAISLVYVLIINVPVLLAGIWVFMKKMRDCIPTLRFVTYTATKNVLSLGMVFFMCQIFYAMIMNTDQFLITKFYGPLYTADYTFYYRVVMFLATVSTLALTPTWAVVTKACQEKDYKWLCKLFRVIKLSALGLMILEFALIPCIQFIMNIWLGKGQINVEIPVAFSFAVFASTFIYSGMLSTMVCGLGRMKLQLYSYGVAVAVKFVVVGLLYETFGWQMVVWINAIVLGLFCFVELFDLVRYFSHMKQTTVS